VTEPLETTGQFFKERYAKRRTDHALDPPFPDDCMVELTNACNHECVFCANPRMKRRIARLSLDLWRRFVGEALPLGLKEVGFYATGEPFMVPNLHDFIQIATDAGIGYTYVTTNGTLATPERMRKVLAAGLKSIKFSINAATRESYRLVHGADDFDKVRDNVIWLHGYRQESGLDFHILGSCAITSAIAREKDLHKAIFGSYIDDIMYHDVHGQAGQSNAEAARVTAREIAFPPMGTAEPCFMLWKRVHLTAEGYLTLCCVDYENNLTYARLDDGPSLMGHWHNAVMIEMRRRHIRQDLGGTLCHTCLYGGDAPYSPISDIGRLEGDHSSPKKLRRLNERIGIIHQMHPGPPQPQ